MCALRITPPPPFPLLRPIRGKSFRFIFCERLSGSHIERATLPEYTKSVGCNSVLLNIVLQVVLFCRKFQVRSIRFLFLFSSSPNNSRLKAHARSR
jgi:hypothetical protein